MKLSTLIPEAQAASDALERLTQMQRISLAIYLVRDIDNPTCEGALRRLSRLSGDMANEMMAAAFGRECG